MKDVWCKIFVVLEIKVYVGEKLLFYSEILFNTPLEMSLFCFSISITFTYQPCH